jgi:hypothetical protein
MLFTSTLSHINYVYQKKVIDVVRNKNQDMNSLTKIKTTWPRFKAKTTFLLPLYFLSCHNTYMKVEKFPKLPTPIS